MKKCSILDRCFVTIMRPKILFFCIRQFFFISWFTDPPTQKIFLTFFIFSDVKKLPDLIFFFFKYSKKNNKNCMILHCKNAEMTIVLSFLHFYSVKSYNFCYFFSLIQICFRLNKNILLVIFIFIFSLLRP